jgi:hypothetical protein
MKLWSYIDGWNTALRKFGMDSHDVKYMAPGQRFKSMETELAKANADRVWDIFGTKEGPGSGAGFGEESSHGIM